MRKLRVLFLALAIGTCATTATVFADGPTETPGVTTTISPGGGTNSAETGTTPEPGGPTETPGMLMILIDILTDVI